MFLRIIRSGSKNNATLIRTNNLNILIDIGISLRLLNDEIKDLNITANNIDHLFITHTHLDHINGLIAFLKNSKANIWMTKSCFMELTTKKNYEEINNYLDRIKPIIKETEYKTIKLNNVTITPLELSHDKPETLGFIIESDIKYTQITDTGIILEKTVNLAKNSHILNLEANYDLEMLKQSGRKQDLIKRIMSDEGHLENRQSMLYLKEMIGLNTKYLIHSHRSSDCNLKYKIKAAREKIIPDPNIKSLFASRVKSLTLEL